jgi:hypothetical protein
LGYTPRAPRNEGIERGVLLGLNRLILVLLEVTPELRLVLERAPQTAQVLPRPPTARPYPPDRRRERSGGGPPGGHSTPCHGS